MAAISLQIDSPLGCLDQALDRAISLEISGNFCCDQSTFHINEIHHRLEVAGF